jgi:MoaA/NifB/PqqE/SkfB family radical SAM enzyme
VGGHNLRLEREPAVEEVVAELEKLNLDEYGEFVFCGFGEPLYAFEKLIAIGRFLRGKGKKTRLNTNGQASLIVRLETLKRVGGAEILRGNPEIKSGFAEDAENPRENTGEIDVSAVAVGILSQAVDAVSISLNASDAEKYDGICRCAYGAYGFYSMLDFARECVGKIRKVILSVVDTIGAEEIERCGKIATEIGAELRVRKYGAV